MLFENRITLMGHRNKCEQYVNTGIKLKAWFLYNAVSDVRIVSIAEVFVTRSGHKDTARFSLLM